MPLNTLSPAALFAQGPAAPPAPPGPTGPGSGGRHVATVRDDHGVHVTVTENGVTRRYEGAEAEAWLAANPQPTPPQPPVSPVPPVSPTPPAPPAPPQPGAQARTIVVRPGAAGRPTLMVARSSVDAGAPLPSGVALPPDFDLPADCGRTDKAPPPAMVLKGEGGDRSYTVLCTRPTAGSTAAIERGAYRQALSGLRTARRSVVGQAITLAWPETERRNALAAIDASIAELEANLAEPK